MEIYAKELGIRKKPWLVLPHEFHAMHINRNDKIIEDERGAYCPSCDMMYVNPNGICVWHICEAVAHELVHKKYPKMRHGKKFDKLVGSIIVCD
jgi:hypothetical protein